MTRTRQLSQSAFQEFICLQCVSSLCFFFLIKKIMSQNLTLDFSNFSCEALTDRLKEAEETPAKARCSVPSLWCVLWNHPNNLVFAGFS